MARPMKNPISPDPVLWARFLDRSGILLDTEAAQPVFPGARVPAPVHPVERDCLPTRKAA
jgi:hypothetical protein